MLYAKRCFREAKFKYYKAFHLTQCLLQHTDYVPVGQTSKTRSHEHVTHVIHATADYALSGNGPHLSSLSPESSQFTVIQSSGSAHVARQEADSADAANLEK